MGGSRRVRATRRVLTFHAAVHWLRNKWLLLVAVLLVLFVAGLIMQRPSADTLTLPPPVQQQHTMPEVIIHQGKKGPVQIRLLADFQITAVVKSKQRYVSDTASQVSPLDLVLAWGEMNQATIDRQISYSQANRWYHVCYPASLAISSTYLTENTANVHLIPASPEIESQLHRIRVQDLITLEGYLVEVTFEEGTWTSSLSRSDTGDGACEILYVRRVRHGVSAS